MQTVETVKLNGFQNVTLMIKWKYQSNGRYIMNKNRDKSLQRQKDKHVHFIYLKRTDVELVNRIKTFEENIVGK